MNLDKKQIKTILKIPAIISKITTMSDLGIRIQVDTQEINAEDAGNVMLLKGKIGWFIFADQPIQDTDLDELPKRT